MFQIGNACKAVEANKQKIAPFCYLRCLQFQDYVDLLYTTFAEFPGLFITMAIIELIGRKKTMAVEFLAFSFLTFLLNICTTRQVLIFFLFSARCFISGAFQAAYVYTPEVSKFKYTLNKSYTRIFYCQHRVSIIFSVKCLND